MKITSPRLDTSHLNANEEALLKCQTAYELKDKGDYEGAREVMSPFWERLGERPEIKRLHPSVSAEVLLCAGILTGWIGSKNEIKEAQEVAKNLITEGITYYDSVGDVKKIAAARAELACCYWRDGELNEARIVLTEALQKLPIEGNTRARALIMLATVEWSASRYNVAYEILTDNASVFKRITNHTTKGNYHNELAIVLRHLAKSDLSKRKDYLQRSISEFQKADHHFTLAKNHVFRASVKNNLALILFNLSRFKEAHRYLVEARRLSVLLRDKVRTAQFDDTRAQVLIAERKLKEAEAVARSAVRVLEKSGRQCLLADALVTHGIALARLKQTKRAQFIFQRAFDVAHQVGALNKAGMAALTLIEELDQAAPETLSFAFDRASEWLANAQDEELWRRLHAAARRVFARLRGELDAETATEGLSNKPFKLHEEILKLEDTLIRHTLAKVNGSLTRAAEQMGMSYQGLAYIIQRRHPKLLKERSPVRRRSRKKEMQDE
jgi:tetratricopeptide (TPR) repeat protein